MIKKKDLNKVLNIVIPIEIYDYDLIYSQNQTNEELIKSVYKYRKSNGITEKIPNGALELLKMDNGEALTIMNNDKMIVIRIFKHSSKLLPSFLNSVAHEIFHAVNEVMDYINMTLDRNNEEAYAYLTGFLMEKIIRGVIK